MKQEVKSRLERVETARGAGAMAWHGDDIERGKAAHRSKTGHEMCHENDEELWRALNDGVIVDHTPPSWCEFMTRCALYRQSKGS